MAERHSANLYIDGFNLYYGLLKNTSHKWLNPVLLVQQILPYLDIQNTEYFTADITPFPSDPDKGNRQELYYRALKTVPNLTIVKGHYSVNPAKMPLCKGFPYKVRMVDVMKFEEKGSDVNLATHLLRDAFKNVFHTAVVISNDSDLEEPIRICNKDLNKYIYVLNPQDGYPSKDLRLVATKQLTIRRPVPSSCLFPQKLSDSEGIFNKPISW